MKLYRYRSIKSALMDLDNGEFYFADYNDLNDPIEGYIRIYWQGDKFAFEGLLKNYICSFFYSIQKYLLTINPYYVNFSTEEVLNEFKERSQLIDMTKLKHMPARKIFGNLIEDFLDNDNVIQIAEFYGNENIRCVSRELEFILRTVTDAAFHICIDKFKELEFIDDDFDAAYFDIDFGFSINDIKGLSDKERLSKICKLENMICDTMESGLLNMKSAPKRVGKRNYYRIKKHLLWLRLTFPKMYTAQLKEMLYPAGYVVCFSNTATNSAMWGNYAENHSGVCFVYETENIDGAEKFPFETRNFEVKPIRYTNTVIERNFFETLKNLEFIDVKEWFIGRGGVQSKLLDTSPTEDDAKQYRQDFIDKFYIKMPEWRHENEYRILLADRFYQYSDPISRKLKFMPKMLKGLIFGIRTTLSDRAEIIQKIGRLIENDADFEFYQAEYDDVTKTISVRNMELFLK